MNWNRYILNLVNSRMMVLKNMMNILLLLSCSLIIRLCESLLSKHNINDIVYDTLPSSLFLKSLLTLTKNKNNNNNKLSYLTSRKLQKKLYLSYISDGISMESPSSLSLSSQLLLSQEEVITTVTNYIPPEVTSEIWLVMITTITDSIYSLFIIIVLNIVLVKLVIIKSIIIFSIIIIIIIIIITTYIIRVGTAVSLVPIVWATIEFTSRIRTQQQCLLCKGKLYIILFNQSYHYYHNNNYYNTHHRHFNYPKYHHHQQ